MNAVTFIVIGICVLFVVEARSRAWQAEHDRDVLMTRYYQPAPDRDGMGCGAWILAIGILAIAFLTVAIQA